MKRISRADLETNDEEPKFVPMILPRSVIKKLKEKPKFIPVILPKAARRKLISVALTLIFLAGCAGNQAQPQAEVDIKPVMDQLIEVHKEYIEAINTFQLMSEDLVRIALFEVGFAREAMGADLQLIPGEALSILDKYEKIARKYEGKQMTDYEKGQIAGMRWRFIYKMGDWLVEKVGPSVLQIFKLAL